MLEKRSRLGVQQTGLLTTRSREVYSMLRELTGRFTSRIHTRWQVVSAIRQPDKFKFHRSSFLVASSCHPRRHARHPCEDATSMSRATGMSDDFPVQLAMRLPDWSAGGLLRCIVLPVCPCVVSFAKFHEPDTHDLLRISR